MELEQVANMMDSNRKLMRSVKGLCVMEGEKLNKLPTTHDYVYQESIIAYLKGISTYLNKAQSEMSQLITDLIDEENKS